MPLKTLVLASLVALLAGCATMNQLLTPLPIKLSNVSVSEAGTLKAVWDNPDHHNATVVEVSDNPGFSGVSVNYPAIGLLVGLPLPAGDKLYIRLATLKNNVPTVPWSEVLKVERHDGKAVLVP